MAKEPEHRALGEQGAALVMTLMAMTLVMALGTALALLAAAEIQISLQYRGASQAAYAANAAIDLVLDELRDAPDWNGVLTGERTSRLVDGIPVGRRETPGGPIDLATAAANPGWRLYAYGPLRSLAGLGPLEGDAYTIVWLSGDVAGRAEVLGVLAHAYGSSGVRRAVEVWLERDGPQVRRLSWHEVR